MKSGKSTKTAPTLSPSEEQRYAELQKMALDLARWGRTDELRHMIAAGMPVNLSDEKGQSLLMLASYNGRLATTQMLLENGAEPDRRNDRGQTPLGGVAFKGYADIAEVLIEYGADIHADNGGGMAPVHYAAMFGNFNVVQVLKKHGAELKKSKSGTTGSGRGWMPALARGIGKVRKVIKS